MECFSPGGDRNIYLLTHEMGEAPARLEMTVEIQRLEPRSAKEGRLDVLSSLDDSSFVGFRFGVRGVLSDVRNRAFAGQGAKAGIDLNGRLFIGAQNGPAIDLGAQPIKLTLIAEPDGDDYRLTLSAYDLQDNQLGVVVRDQYPAKDVFGGVGLICHSGEEIDRDVSYAPPQRFPRRGTEVEFSDWNSVARFAFRNFTVSGDALVEDQSNGFGPINFALYSQSRGTLKLTAQMMPVATLAGDDVTLEVRYPGSDTYSELQTVQIDRDAYTARFKIEDWDARVTVPYRVTYQMQDRSGHTTRHAFEGVIRAEPEAGDMLSVASLSCHFDAGYPHTGLVTNVLSFDPDMVIFSGDQIYEFNSGYGIISEPPRAAQLDYLRKWYHFGWAFRDLLRDRPSIVIPDDHDVFHGAIYGAAGRALEGDRQNLGGYKMPPDWVNMVQRTQTSHLPDPVDATPVLQGIDVYFTDLLYGGVSFAILEDRKWKSAPRDFFSRFWINWKSRDWTAWRRRFGINDKPSLGADVEGATLLGDRQMAFLKNWSADWSGDARIKAVVSQTPFSATNTYTYKRLRKGD